jgi:hypothetical protein
MEKKGKEVTLTPHIMFHVVSYSYPHDSVPFISSEPRAQQHSTATGDGDAAKRLPFRFAFLRFGDAKTTATEHGGGEGTFQARTHGAMAAAGPHISVTLSRRW